MKKVLITLSLILSLVLIFTFVACENIDTPSVTFEVKFMVNDEEYATQTVEVGKAVTLPEDPVKEGYTFGGWYLDTEFAIPLSENSFTNINNGVVTIAVYGKMEEILCYNGHMPSQAVQRNIVPASCTEGGSYDDVVYCAICNGVISTTPQTIDALGHDLIHHDAKEATVTNVGWYAYDTCSRCDYTTYREIPIVTEEALILSSTQITFNEFVGTLTLSNATKTFDILSDLTISSGATMKVFADSSLTVPVDTSAVNLNQGDNTFYIVITSQSQTTTNQYNVEIHRNRMLSITFNTAGGKYLAPIYVEENTIATNVPTPTKTGYEFTGWTFDFTQPITESLTTVATWEAQGDRIYTINYYFQNVDDDEYTLSDTPDVIQSTTNKIVTITPKTIPHFAVNLASSGNLTAKVLADNSTTFNLYYDRIVYSVNYKANGGTLVTGEATQSLRFGARFTFPTFERTGYTFDGFDNDEETISNATVINAKWKLINYTITYDLAEFPNYQNNNPTTYTIEDTITFTFSYSSDYFVPSWYLSGEPITTIQVGSYGDITLVLSWYSTVFTIEGSTITGLTEEGRCLDILDIHNMVPIDITAIGPEAFVSAINTEIILPDTLISIGEYAFARSIITSITLPTSLKTIGKGAFRDCSHLENIVIPEGIQYIEESVFECCSNLVSVSLPSTLKDIRYNAFDSCYHLVEICNKSSLEIVLGSTAFGEIALNAISIVTELPNPTRFFKNSEYMSYDTGTDVWLVQYYMQTRTIIIPTRVTRIGNYACYYNMDVAFVGFDNNIKSIGKHAFENCASLLRVRIGKNVESIGDKAFYGCFKLYEVWNHSSSLDPHALSTDYGYLGYYSKQIYTNEDTQQTKLQTIDGAHIIYNEDANTKIYMGYIGYATSITLPEVDEICPYAFYQDYYVKEVDLGTNDFTDLPRTVVQNSNIANLSDGVIYFGYLAMGYSEYKDIESDQTVEIKEGTKYIVTCAFEGRTDLTKITLPESLITIQPEAFKNSGLTEINIPDSLTHIGKNAFENCSALTEVDIQEVRAVFYTTSESSWLASDNNSQLLIVNSSADFTTFITENPDYYYFIAYNSGVTYVKTGNYYEVAGITTADKQVVIRDNIDGVAVSVIRNDAFANNSNITAIVLPDTITKIQSNAFENCYSLETIRLSNSLKNILYGAFKDCEMLSNITLPDSIIDMEDDIFYGCDSLSEITLPANLTNLGNDTFYDCRSLRTVNINNNLKVIGNRAFGRCMDLIDVTIPEGVTEINSSAFSECEYLNSITILSTLNAIESYTFAYCYHLTNVIIKEGVTCIGESAFEDCYLLASITIPASVVTIEAGAFKGCTELTFNIAAGNTIFYMDGTALINRTNKTLVCGGNDGYIPGDGSVTAIGNAAFSGITAKNIVVPDCITSIGKKAFFLSKINTVTLGIGLEHIGYDAFCACSQLKSITFLDPYGWYGSSNHSVTYETGTVVDLTDSAKNASYFRYPQNYNYIYSCVSKLYSKGLEYVQNSDGTYKIISEGTCTDSHIIIPATHNGRFVTDIDIGAFSGCAFITKITLTPYLNSVGKNAFYGTNWYNNCPNNQVIYIDTFAYCYKGTAPSGTSITIKEGTTGVAACAFDGQSGITQVSLPNTLKYIGFFSFSNTGLTNLVIPGSVETLETGCFEDASNLAQLTISEGVKSIGVCAFSGCKKLTKVTIPNSVTSMGAGAFSECTGLTEITIPFVGNRAGVTNNDAYQYPFGYIFGTQSIYGTYECMQSYYDGINRNQYLCYIPSALNKVTVTGGNILYGAFQDWNGQTMILGNDVTSIGNYAFSACCALSSIVIPNSVQTIGVYAFWNCSALESITIGSGVTSIGAHAFYKTGLTSITIPNNVVSIDAYAFKDCYDLTSAKIGNGVINIGDCAFENCLSLESATLGGCVKNIGEYAFNSCSSLVSINIPNSVKSIGANAFLDCNKIESITIPNGVTSIGASAFEGCSKLVSINIPDSITRISERMFWHCYALSSITISNSVTIIDHSAFLYCTSLENITIPNSVERISYYAFYNCSALTSVTIAESVYVIDAYAFNYCKKLTSITYQGTKVKWDNILKGGFWDEYTGNYVIHCTNGDINKVV